MGYTGVKMTHTLYLILGWYGQVLWTAPSVTQGCGPHRKDDPSGCLHWDWPKKDEGWRLFEDNNPTTWDDKPFLDGGSGQHTCVPHRQSAENRKSTAHGEHQGENPEYLEIMCVNPLPPVTNHGALWPWATLTPGKATSGPWGRGATRDSLPQDLAQSSD